MTLVCRCIYIINLPGDLEGPLRPILPLWFSLKSTDVRGLGTYSFLGLEEVSLILKFDKRDKECKTLKVTPFFLNRNENMTIHKNIKNEYLYKQSDISRVNWRLKNMPSNLEPRTQTCPLSCWIAVEGSLRPVCGSSPELGPEQKAGWPVQSVETQLIVNNHRSLAYYLARLTKVKFLMGFLHHFLEGWTCFVQQLPLTHQTSPVPVWSHLRSLCLAFSSYNQSPIVVLPASSGDAVKINQIINQIDGSKLLSPTQ